MCCSGIPLNIFKGQVPNMCIFETCSGTLSIKSWRTGQSQSLQPRRLHCVERTVVLVPPLFQCEFGHSVASTDPHFTESVLQDQVPFVLLHRNGFTKTLINTVTHLFHQGMNIHSIEFFIQRMRDELCASLITQLVHAIPKNQPTTTWCTRTATRT